MTATTTTTTDSNSTSTWNPTTRSSWTTCRWYPTLRHPRTTRKSRSATIAKTTPTARNKFKWKRTIFSHHWIWNSHRGSLDNQKNIVTTETTSDRSFQQQSNSGQQNSERTQLFPLYHHRHSKMSTGVKLKTFDGNHNVHISSANFEDWQKFHNETDAQALLPIGCNFDDNRQHRITHCQIEGKQICSYSNKALETDSHLVKQHSPWWALNKTLGSQQMPT